MKEKGFTLIELLAVIVILAIIALIATPIILNIIGDAKKESNERSIELYVSAVKHAAAKYQLASNAPVVGTLKTTDGRTFEGTSFKVEYDGDVVCDIVEIYEDGTIYLANCKVNGDLIEGYTYGTKQVTQVYKPQYYNYGSGNVGEDLPSDAKENVSEITTNTDNHPYYLGYDVVDGKVSVVYVCFVKNDTEYCLKGDTNAYTTNQRVLTDAYGESHCTLNDVGFNCYESVGEESGACGRDSGCLFGGVSTVEDVVVGVGDDIAGCNLHGDGIYECY